jgi:polysaccharide pyruvyl transferase WcaK-like protein
MLKALLINRGNTDNLGDKAINFAMKSFLEKAGLEVDFRDLIGEKEIKIDYLKEADFRLNKNSNSDGKAFKSISLKRISWFFKRAGMFSVCFEKYKYDVVFIGGGQLINSNVYFPIAIFFWITLFKVFAKTKIIVFGIGSESDFNWFDRWLYKSALQKADKIYVRDNESQKILSNTFKVSSEYTPDVVFGIKQFTKSYGSVKINKALIGPTSLKRLKKHNNKIVAQWDVDFWEGIILNYLKRNFVTELFYTTIEDLVECKKIQESIKLKYNLNVHIAKINSLEDLILVISSSQVIVSQRMHALILGQLYGCMLEPILISDKLISFKKQYLDVQNDLNELSEIVEKALKNSLHDLT